ncbi:hypothetical protein [Nocardioides terrisoli]|nr:hypothetical protein [Nocardioides marmorisolisilvae]
MSVAPAEPLHAHTWQLRAVEYDEGGEVSMLECAECGAVDYAPA